MMCAENYVLKNHQACLVSFPFPPAAVGCQLGEPDQACPSLLPGDLQNFCTNYTNIPNSKRGIYTQEQWTSIGNAAPKHFSPFMRVNSLTRCLPGNHIWWIFCSRYSLLRFFYWEHGKTFCVPSPPHSHTRSQVISQTIFHKWTIFVQLAFVQKSERKRTCKNRTNRNVFFKTLSGKGLIYSF